MGTPLPATDGHARWDLSPIFASDGDAAEHLDRLADDSAAFADRLPDLSTLDAGSMAAVLGELSDLKHRLRRVRSYAELRAAEDSNDTAAADMASLIEQRSPAVDDALRAFVLAWLAVPDDVAAALAGDPLLSADHHFLTSSRRFAPHTLSAGEERALAARGVAADLAWRRLWFDESSALVLACDLGDGERDQTLSDLRGGLTDARPEVRRTAHQGLMAQSRRLAETSARCLDAVVGDRLSIDPLRGFDDPMMPAHLDNELEPGTVDAMLSTIERRSDIWQRWMRVKAAHLGVTSLQECDRRAPIGTPPDLPYDQATEIVIESFTALSPDAGRTVASVFADGRVDAAPRPGKLGGAFCCEVDDRVGCFVLLNHTDRLFDAQVMAHELGHALNFDRCFPLQSAHVSLPSMALGEVPSTLAELLLCDGLRERAVTAGERVALTGSAVETAVGSVFDVGVAAGFERDMYALKRTGVTLTEERLSEIWQRRRTHGLGDSVAGASNDAEWATFPHYLMFRFYVYSYAFACLVALVLMSRRRRDPAAFAVRYLSFLDRGGSASPQEQLAALEVDLRDPNIWDEGLAELERMIDQAEQELPAAP